MLCLCMSVLPSLPTFMYQIMRLCRTIYGPTNTIEEKSDVFVCLFVLFVFFGSLLIHFLFLVIFASTLQFVSHIRRQCERLVFHAFANTEHNSTCRLTAVARSNNVLSSSSPWATVKCIKWVPIPLAVCHASMIARTQSTNGIYSFHFFVCILRLPA